MLRTMDVTVQSGFWVRVPGSLDKQPDARVGPASADRLPGPREFDLLNGFFGSALGLTRGGGVILAKLLGDIRLTAGYFWDRLCFDIEAACR